MAKYTPNKNKKSITKKNDDVKKIQETEGGNFGKYMESTGGGTPFEKGNTNTRTTQENGKKRQSQNPTTNQPRTNDGKFTYKSVNGKSIDPKYGPSRGKTVNPLLTGGENGIEIEDVEKQFGGQSGAYWDKYKDKWYQKGGKVVTQGLSTKVSAETIWNMAKRRYDTVKGEFLGESESWSTKTGKKSAAEQAAIEKAKATGEQQYAIDASTGAIETKGGMKKALKDFAEKKKAPEKAPVVEEKVEESVTAEQPAKEQPAPVIENPEDKKPWGSGKYNIGQKNKAIASIKKELGDEYDPEIWEDETNLEEFIESNPTILD